MSVDIDNVNNEDKYRFVEYVLSYETDETEKQDYRDRFLKCLTQDGLKFDVEEVGKNSFIKLNCPFDRLAEEAERIKLEMPLKGLQIQAADPACCTFFQGIMATDDEVDFVSAPFEVSKLHIFEGFEDSETFFRSSLKGYLVHHILINVNIEEENDENDSRKKKGLRYLLMKKAFTDAFVLHNQSAEEQFYLRIRENSLDEYYKSVPHLNSDPRSEMQSTWMKFWKFQPLWKIRNYFGEKIAFYFAWLGTLLTLLWMPAILGILIFGYGVYESINHTDELRCIPLPGQNVTKEVEICHVNSKFKALSDDLFGTIKESFDNVFTPFFSFIICLWSALFLEIWKRHRYTLEYQWDVGKFEETEPDRPQFYGAVKREDPITGELRWIYPMSYRIRKFIISFIVIGFMIALVFVSVTLVVAAKVSIRHSWKCPSDDEDVTKYDKDPNAASRANCMIFVTVIPSIINAISIMILGWIYSKIAHKLTDWENYRTQSEYNDALILKLFAFQFVNTYASLFYMALFRPEDHGFQSNGIFGWGSEFKDTCRRGSCMSLLSFQVLVLMLVKPFPKFGVDIVLPWLKRLFRRMKTSKIETEINSASGNSETSASFIQREFLKPDGGDFTMEEYSEKVIVFGYIVMFSACFPLAPLIALLLTLGDMRIDANRLLWLNRRPVAFIASDIGMWFNILEFLILCGVVSNAFIIAFTSSFCENLMHPNQCTIATRLTIVVVFEHVVFLLMNLISVSIPDIPYSIKLAKRRERFQVQKILEAGRVPLRSENESPGQKNDPSPHKNPSADEFQKRSFSPEMTSSTETPSGGRSYEQ